MSWNYIPFQGYSNRHQNWPSHGDGQTRIKKIWKQHDVQVERLLNISLHRITINIALLNKCCFAYHFVILKLRIYNFKGVESGCMLLFTEYSKALIIKGILIRHFDSLSMVTLTLNVLRNVSIMLNRRNTLSKHAKPISNKLKEFLISKNKVLWNICC